MSKVGMVKAPPPGAEPTAAQSHVPSKAFPPSLRALGLDCPFPPAKADGMSEAVKGPLLGGDPFAPAKTQGMSSAPRGPLPDGDPFAPAKAQGKTEAAQGLLPGGDAFAPPKSQSMGKGAPGPIMSDDLSPPSKAQGIAEGAHGLLPGGDQFVPPKSKMQSASEGAHGALPGGDPFAPPKSHRMPQAPQGSKSAGSQIIDDPPYPSGDSSATAKSQPGKSPALPRGWQAVASSKAPQGMPPVEVGKATTFPKGWQPMSKVDEGLQGDVVSADEPQLKIVPPKFTPGPPPPSLGSGIRPGTKPCPLPKRLGPP